MTTEPMDSDAPISFTVTLPASVWDRLTANLKNMRRDATGDPDAPDLALADRVEAFLDWQVSLWRERSSPWGGKPEDYLDDNAPF